MKDQLGNKLVGDPAFFDWELSLFIPTDDTFWEIKDFIKQRKINNKTQWLVTWVGWPDEFASWVNLEDLKNI